LAIGSPHLFEHLAVPMASSKLGGTKNPTLPRRMALSIQHPAESFVSISDSAADVAPGVTPNVAPMTGSSVAWCGGEFPAKANSP
jgi:hypothetical protein